MLPQIGKPKLMIIVGVILILMATFLAYNWLADQRRMDEERRNDYGSILNTAAIFVSA